MRFEQISEINTENVAKLLTDYPDEMEIMINLINQLIQNVNRLATTISLEDNVDCEVRTFEYEGGSGTIDIGLNSNQNPRQIIVGKVNANDGSAITDAVQVTDWGVNIFRNLQLYNISGLTVGVKYTLTITIYY